MSFKSTVKDLSNTSKGFYEIEFPLSNVTKVSTGTSGLTGRWSNNDSDREIRNLGDLNVQISWIPDLIFFETSDGKKWMSEWTDRGEVKFSQSTRSYMRGDSDLGLDYLPTYGSIQLDTVSFSNGSDELMN